jgi:hypothetical protein
VEAGYVFGQAVIALAVLGLLGYALASGIRKRRARRARPLHGPFPPRGPVPPPGSHSAPDEYPPGPYSPRPETEGPAQDRP